MPPVKKAAAVGVSFLEPEFYSGGSRGIPAGTFALSFSVAMHAFQKQDGSQAGPEQLKIIVDAVPINDDGSRRDGDVVQGFYGLGSKAHLSFQPHPDNDKMIIAVPNGPASTLNDQTNWSLFLKSLYDSGLPKGVVSDDLSGLDGVWVRTTQVPEPEGRKGMKKSATGIAGLDGQPEANRTPGVVTVVSEILDGGAPWEGGGSVPGEAEEAKPAAAAKKGAVLPMKGKTAAAAKAAEPEPVEAAGDDEEELTGEVMAAVAEALAAHDGKPVLRPILGTAVFKLLKKKELDVAGKPIFNDADKLKGILSQLGFAIDKSGFIKPTA